MPIDLNLAEARASCHCGAVRLKLRLSAGLHSARRCDCSLCRMRGAIVVSAPLDGIDILQGADALTLYQFGTRTAEHYFCRHCGIYTHHRRRSNPNEYGVNVACLDGISPFDFHEVAVLNGREHESDGGRGGFSGLLRYLPTP